MTNSIPPLPVNWVRNQNNGQYFDFLRLDLDSPYFIDKRGVYIIWYTTPTGGKAIYIGQGNIGERLKMHRQNWRITQYSRNGQLKVTWALIDDEDSRKRIEAGLYQNYGPLENEIRPSGNPIFVTPI